MVAICEYLELSKSFVSKESSGYNDGIRYRMLWLTRWFSLDQLQLKIEFVPHLASHIFGLVANLIYA